MVGLWDINRGIITATQKNNRLISVGYPPGIIVADIVRFIRIV